MAMVAPHSPMPVTRFDKKVNFDQPTPPASPKQSHLSMMFGKAALNTDAVESKTTSITPTTPISRSNSQSNVAPKSDDNVKPCLKFECPKPDKSQCASKFKRPSCGSPPPSKRHLLYLEDEDDDDDDDELDANDFNDNEFDDLDDNDQVLVDDDDEAIF